MDANTAIVRFINRIPILRQFIDQYINDINTSGPVFASQQLIKRYHGKINVHIPAETAKILKSSGCIIAFNHPCEIETYVIQACLPSRDDIKMIATANILAVAPPLKTYIIPVWIDHTAKREKRAKFSGKIAKLFSLRPDLNPIEAHQNNIRSISEAANQIKHGGMVLIAPEGFRGKGGRWFTGIGHLIAEIGRKTEADYISCYISGTSDFDWFRFIPLINRLYPPVQIYFSEPRKLTDILAFYHEPKLITLELEKSYQSWTNSLNN